MRDNPHAELVYEDDTGFHRYPVALEPVSCFYGGMRWYFRCPLFVNGVPCRRRVSFLYKHGPYFGCRTCHNLAYPLQRTAHKGRWARLYRAAQALNWYNKIVAQRTKLWRGRPTKRQQNRLVKLDKYSDGL